MASSPPTNAAPTSKDVARMAGVSQTTVSRVLSGASSVSTETRARVLAAIEQVNYAPNHSARAMRTRRSGTVGIVVARLTNPFYPELLEALNRALSAQGLRMILWDAELLGEEPAVDAIRAGLVDGIMFTTVVRDSPAVRAAFDGGAPIVIVNRPALRGARGAGRRRHQHGARGWLPRRAERAWRGTGRRRANRRGLHARERLRRSGRADEPAGAARCGVLRQ